MEKSLQSVGAMQINVKEGLSSVKLLKRKGGAKRAWRHKQTMLDSRGEVDARMRRPQKKKLAHLIPL